MGRAFFLRLSYNQQLRIVGAYEKRVFYVSKMKGGYFRLFGLGKGNPSYFK